MLFLSQHQLRFFGNKKSSFRPINIWFWLLGIRIVDFYGYFKFLYLAGIVHG